MKVQHYDHHRFALLGAALCLQLACGGGAPHLDFAGSEPATPIPGRGRPEHQRFQLLSQSTHTFELRCEPPRGVVDALNDGSLDSEGVELELASNPCEKRGLALDVVASGAEARRFPVWWVVEPNGDERLVELSVDSRAAETAGKLSESEVARRLGLEIPSEIVTCYEGEEDCQPTPEGPRLDRRQARSWSLWAKVAVAVAEGANLGTGCEIGLEMDPKMQQAVAKLAIFPADEADEWVVEAPDGVLCTGTGNYRGFLRGR